MSILSPVLCIMGPTASGKTDLALALADLHPFEIVSVDSVLIYRGMDIGTAKPSKDILSRYPHHLIDIRDPREAYSAAEFRADAIRIMTDISMRGRTPLLVGGTMLYFKALRDGLAELPSADPVIRERIAKMALAEGWPAVHGRLSEVDPVAAKRINPNDPQRLQRALEVYEVSGRSLTSFHQQGRPDCPFELVQIAIVPPDRKELHRRIGGRFRQMVERGLVEEVKALHGRSDLSPDLPAIRAVGYRQAWQYLEGSLSHTEMVERGIIATRQLAKRQLTWLRSWPDLHVIPGPDVTLALKVAGSGSILD